MTYAMLFSRLKTFAINTNPLAQEYILIHDESLSKHHSGVLVLRKS